MKAQRKQFENVEGQQEQAHEEHKLESVFLERQEQVEETSLHRYPLLLHSQHSHQNPEKRKREDAKRSGLRDENPLITYASMFLARVTGKKQKKLEADRTLSAGSSSSSSSFHPAS